MWFNSRLENYWHNINTMFHVIFTVKHGENNHRVRRAAVGYFWLEQQPATAERQPSSQQQQQSEQQQQPEAAGSSPEASKKKQPSEQRE